MRNFLLLISLLLPLLVTAVAEPVEAPAISQAPSTLEAPASPRDTALFPFPSASAARYNVTITFGSTSFSGICVVKRLDGHIAGSLVNEFGIRAFDFTMTSDRRRVKLLNITKPLDRCLVRKAIRADLRKLFTATSADDYVTFDGRTVVMRLRGRSYAFSKMKTQE